MDTIDSQKNMSDEKRLQIAVVCLKRMLLYTKDPITKTLIEETLRELNETD